MTAFSRAPFPFVARVVECPTDVFIRHPFDDIRGTARGDDRVFHSPSRRCSVDLKTYPEVKRDAPRSAFLGRRTRASACAWAIKTYPEVGVVVHDRVVDRPSD